MSLATILTIALIHLAVVGKYVHHLPVIVKHVCLETGTTV